MKLALEILEKTIAEYRAAPTLKSKQRIAVRFFERNASVLAEEANKYIATKEG